MNNLEKMGYGATKLARGLLLIITLGSYDKPFDTDYALWIAQRHWRASKRKTK